MGDIMSEQISAIVPAYNAEKYLDACLQSLIRQRSELKEIIVIDDGSTDRTAEIALCWSDRFSHVRLLANEKNSGVSFSRNKGIMSAVSEWILLVDADDVIDELLVENHRHEMKRYYERYRREGILCFSAYEQIDADGMAIPGVFSFKEVAAEEMLGYLFVRNNIYLTGTSLNKRAFVEAGMFDIGMTHDEDLDLWLKMAQQGGFVYIDKPLFKVRRHSGNASKRLQDVLYAERKVLDKYDVDFIRGAVFCRYLPAEKNHMDFVSILLRLERYELAQDVIEKVCKNYPRYAPGFFFQGLLHVKEKETKEAIESFKKAVDLDPNHGAALNNLGAVLSIIGNDHEGAYYLNKALALYPEYIDARHNLKLHESKMDMGYQHCRFTWRELRPKLIRYGND